MSSTYRLSRTGQVERQIRRLLRGGTPAFRRRLEETLTRLSENPYPSSESQSRFQIKPLSNGEWSIRIDIHHRIRYVIAGDEVIVTRVSSRESAYGDL